MSAEAVLLIVLIIIAFLLWLIFADKEEIHHGRHIGRYKIRRCGRCGHRLGE